jgi:hypothetical protein
MDNQVPQGSNNRKDSGTDKRTDPGNMPAKRSRDIGGSCIERSYPLVGVRTASPIGEQASTVSKGLQFPQVTNGVQRIEQTILGPTSMGAGIFCSQQWQCDR